MNTFHIEIDFGSQFSKGRYEIEARNRAEALMLAIIRLEESLKSKIKQIYFV